MAKKKLENPVRVSWSVSVGICCHKGVWEIDRAEWDAMTEVQRTEMLDQFMDDEMTNHVDAGYGVLKDGEKADE